MARLAEGDETTGGLGSCTGESGRGGDDGAGDESCRLAEYHGRSRKRWGVPTSVLKA